MPFAQIYERTGNSGKSEEGAAGSEKTYPHEVGTYVIIWWVSPLSGDVRTSVDGPIRALEGEPAPTKSFSMKSLTFGKADIWEGFLIK